MLWIDQSLCDKLEKKYSKRNVSGHFYRFRQWNRYIQVRTPVKDWYVHYEVCPEYIELHFEGDDYATKYQELIDYLEKATEGDETLVWEPWNCGYRCRYNTVLETEEEVLETMAYIKGKFDALINDFQNNKKTIVEQNIIPANDTLPHSDTDVEMHELTLRKVLGLPLSIPDYQRIYCWEEKNVKCLLEDLNEHPKNMKYRLGTIIFHFHDGKYDIIDGQQRLITLALLLNELGVSSAILNENTWTKKSQAYVAYNKYLVQSFCSRHPKDRSEWVNMLLDNVEFTVLVLWNSSIDLAYTFFSNQNSRGVSLTDYDLLKAHHLRYIPSTFEQQSARAAKTWNTMIENGRVKSSNNELPDYVRLLDTYLFYLRKWMRKKNIEEDEEYRIKTEYEAAPIIDGIPPFGERFYFNEPIQGGTHFFAFVERYMQQLSYFIQTEEFNKLHSIMDSSTHCWYRDAIEAVLFEYYLKFGNTYLADAMVVIMRIIVQHRFETFATRKKSIRKYVSDSELVLMIDQATSPTFFLAEACNLAKDKVYPPMTELKPISKRMKLLASQASKAVAQNITINTFKSLNS